MQILYWEVVNRIDRGVGKNGWDQVRLDDQFMMTNLLYVLSAIDGSEYVAFVSTCSHGAVGVIA